MDRLATIRDRLSDSRYRVSYDVPLSDGGIAQIVASRTYFSWKGLVILSQHLVVRTFDEPTVSDVQQLFESGFQLGKSRNRIPLIRGLQFGYMIVPVVIANVINDEVKRYASRQPQKRWALFEFPVVCHANSPEIYYFNSTPLWGAFFFSDLRDVVAKYIAQPHTSANHTLNSSGNGGRRFG